MKAAELEKLIAPLVELDSAELVDLTYAKEGPRWVLRVYLDKGDGITLDDCAYFSDRIGAMLDALDTMDRSYTLEVSSPGMDRVIKKPKDFERFAGKVVHLRLRLPEAGQRNFKGVLRGLRDGKVVLDVDGSEKTFDLAAVDETRIDAASEAEKEL